MQADLECGSVTALQYKTGFFDAVIDVVTLQHLNLRDSESALSEICRVLKPGGIFFSYRISDCSSAFLNSGGKFVDAVTVDNIANTEMPLNNSGPISFWGGRWPERCIWSRRWSLSPLSACQEATVMEHEFGHILGLTNLGATLQSDHEDAANAKHCVVSNSLMYFSSEMQVGIGAMAAAGRVPQLDAQCIADLRANGGR